MHQNDSKTLKNNNLKKSRFFKSTVKPQKQTMPNKS